ncbi:hypothetical protein EQP59_01395 [Ornithobacterium rhinotracheale]|uniref:DUF2007 domain-containing protein n=1 Tax=Ornithobacterium rhinotracheale TaxID=28251 RepID=A0A3R5UQV9_ORNRH|nr:DUF2007 domain-containing protein [Ornithobacterium rhinotracheale]MRJ08427.1 hypothetical protein [Ornithobacterium rhinotracheale]QAR30107.1 hypothetical protein EQP59_01395 [Ornithobacterium rhinotracheale]UOH77620.1 DUF2007 domain-containing protein [Ornithobacterium rhinotracheale]
MSELITLMTFTNDFEAEVVRARLEAEGVSAYLFNENSVYTLGFTIGNSGEIQLKIKAKDLDKAKHILEKNL